MPYRRWHSQAKNGNLPYGYRSTGPKSALEFDPEEYPGLRMIGELRMQGKTAEAIMDAVNAAGYRTNSKRFGARPFTIDTINAILRNEFYTPYEDGDDRGPYLTKGKNTVGYTRRPSQLKNGNVSRLGRS
ncbi:recombinase family protein [Dictyobacter arantiisoli]|uniref:Recombinase domain-containing protein n=1 Tax=Dictyobacter arantiisoli TaxID=2014874 RepID=A0A5A5TIV4_9CHLR|nr:recombinase family protein [Dictyobacter arantiisoli]GCF11347.1 hypothetical protein KDI_49110 [Dictyobacter arantiisoli]